MISSINTVVDSGVQKRMLPNNQIKEKNTHKEHLVNKKALWYKKWYCRGLGEIAEEDKEVQMVSCKIS